MTEERDREPDPVIARAAAMMRAESYGRAEAREALLAKLASAPSKRAVAARRRRSWGGATWATLGCAMAAAAIALMVHDRPWQEASRAGGAAAPSGQLVEFSLAAPQARNVTIVGEFNDWNDRATPMRRAANGQWTAAVSLSPGRHLYSFEVDGAGLIPDPSAPVAPESSFGIRHSVVVVSGGSEY